MKKTTESFRMMGKVFLIAVETGTKLKKICIRLIPKMQQQ